MLHRTSSMILRWRTRGATWRAEVANSLSNTRSWTELMGIESARPMANKRPRPSHPLVPLVQPSLLRVSRDPKPPCWE
eukprot:9485342-Pyramimonas_sp.AAC.1